MDRRRWLLLVGFAWAVVAPVLPVAGGGDDDLDPIVDGRLMVRLRPTTTIQAFVDQFALDHANIPLTLTLIDSIPAEDTHLFSFDHTLLDEMQLQALELKIQTDYLGPFLGWGELLYANQAPEGRTGSFWFSIQPDQGLFDGQFARDLLNLPAAQVASNGAGVVVAVIDTGVDPTHPLLAGRVLPRGFDFLDNDSDPNDEGDGLDNDGDLVVDEMVGHGTFVAGLIVRTAPAAWILPIRVLDSDGGGDNWALAKSIYYAIDQGVEVINISIGSTYNSQAVEDAVEDAKTLGIVVVAAAGNLGQEEPSEFPASTSSSISVAATDHLDVKTAESNFGDAINLTAPGSRRLISEQPLVYDLTQSIVSTLPNGELGVWDGTSMSVGFVAGTAALIRAQHPEWPVGLPMEDPEEIFDTIELRLMSSATNIDAQNPGFEELLGAGRVHTADAVAMGPVAPAIGDLNADGSVGIGDLLILLGDWGLVHSGADLDGSGAVGIGDLLVLLASWS